MQHIEINIHQPVTPEQRTDTLEIDQNLLDRATHDLGELAVETATSQDSLKNLEVASEGSLLAELQAVPEKLYDRIDRAIEKSEFIRTPELEKAIANYYIDHNRLATIVERVIDNTVSEIEASELEASNDVIDNFAMRSAMHALLSAGETTGDREKSLFIAEQVIDSVLFREVCVGATTIDETEREQIVTLQAKLRAAAVQEGVASEGENGEMWWAKSSVPGEIRGRLADPEQATLLLKTKELFWEDSRFAGQLLFHNTPFMGEIAKSGFKLSSRTHRAEKDGFYDSATGIHEGNGYAAHTNVIHWSEEYMTDEYKTDLKAAGRTDERVRHPATIAVPLAEVIATAPYARDSEYGVLELKPDTEAEVTINDSARIAAAADYWANVGERDVMGRSGKDRIFFADNRLDHVKAAHNYVLDAGAGMATDQGNLSKIILLQRDLDRLAKAKFGEGDASYDDLPYYGAGYGYPGTTVLPFDFASTNRPGEKNFPDVSAHKMREYNVNPAYVLNQRTANEHHSYREDGLSLDKQMAELRTQIRELQRESRESDRYAHKVVVPLRQGVIEFMDEGRTGLEVDTFTPAFNHKVATEVNVIADDAVAASNSAHTTYA